MKESNIKEDIKILENWLEELNEIFNKTFINNKKERKALQHILLNYKRVLKENKELRYENERLRTIRYDTKYGTENIHLITVRNLVEINTNKYFIEIEDGEFVDLKQVYQENKDLKARIDKFNESEEK